MLDEDLLSKPFDPPPTASLPYLLWEERDFPLLVKVWSRSKESICFQIFIYDSDSHYRDWAEASVHFKDNRWSIVSYDASTDFREHRSLNYASGIRPHLADFVNLANLLSRNSPLSYSSCGFFHNPERRQVWDRILDWIQGGRCALTTTNYDE